MPNFLLNNGEGGLVQVEELIRFRSMNKHVVEKFNKQDGIEAVKILAEMNTPKTDSYRKFVCMDIHQRGVQGETLLHLCLQNGSYIHMQIALKLIYHFPKMVHDIFIGDKSYGQSAVHLAIVAENPFILKRLIALGADVHQRCVGRFFMPDDQKAKMIWHSVEFPKLPVSTNYQGLSYFGEYPLTFAAVLNQTECVQILIAKKADLNLQDSNGNTVLHILVINDNFVNLPVMFQLFF